MNYKTQNAISLLIAIIPLLVVILGIISVIALVCITPVMESRTYNKLTGAKTTWWDAMWVELRVQDQPHQQP